MAKTYASRSLVLGGACLRRCGKKSTRITPNEFKQFSTKSTRKSQELGGMCVYFVCKPFSVDICPYFVSILEKMSHLNHLFQCCRPSKRQQFQNHDHALLLLSPPPKPEISLPKGRPLSLASQNSTHRRQASNIKVQKFQKPSKIHQR